MRKNVRQSISVFFLRASSVLLCLLFVLLPLHVTHGDGNVPPTFPTSPVINSTPGDSTTLINPIVPSNENLHNLAIQGTISDADGVSDITAVQGVFYLTSIGYDSCVTSYGSNVSNPDCYSAPCSIAPVNATDATFDCGLLFEMNTIATIDGSAYASDDWSIAVKAHDSAANEVDTHYSAVHTEVGQILIADIGTTIIWGTLATGESTDSTNNASQVIQQKGNTPIAISVSAATGMGCTRGSIPLTNISYITTDTGGGTPLSTTPTLVSDFAVPSETTFGIPQMKTLYWNITIPSGPAGAISGTCEGVITETASAA